MTIHVSLPQIIFGIRFCCCWGGRFVIFLYGENISNFFFFLQIGDINGVTVLQHDLFTNDVIYAEVVFDMSFLRQELLPLVPLFW